MFKVEVEGVESVQDGTYNVHYISEYNDETYFLIYNYNENKWVHVNCKKCTPINE